MDLKLPEKVILLNKVKQMEGYTIGLNNVALMMTCSLALPTDVDTVHRLHASAYRPHVLRKQSYVKYNFPKMTDWAERDVIVKGCTVIVAIQLLVHFGAKTIVLVGCEDFDQWEKLALIPNVKLEWEHLCKS